MAATQVFHHALKLFQHSGLNYKMEVSPFSGIINLQNCFLMDKNKNQQTPPPASMMQPQVNTDELSLKLFQQETVINKLFKENAKMFMKFLEQMCSIINLTRQNCRLLNILKTQLSRTRWPLTKLEDELKNKKEKVSNLEPSKRNFKSKWLN